MQLDGSEKSIAAIMTLNVGKDNSFDTFMTGACLHPVLFF
jgi:hypothetical protein